MRDHAVDGHVALERAAEGHRDRAEHVLAGVAQLLRGRLHAGERGRDVAVQVLQVVRLGRRAQHHAAVERRVGRAVRGLDVRHQRHQVGVGGLADAAQHRFRVGELRHGLRRTNEVTSVSRMPDSTIAILRAVGASAGSICRPSRVPTSIPVTRRSAGSRSMRGATPPCGAAGVFGGIGSPSRGDARAVVPHGSSRSSMARLLPGRARERHDSGVFRGRSSPGPASRTSDGSGPPPSRFEMADRRRRCPIWASRRPP